MDHFFLDYVVTHTVLVVLHDMVKKQKLFVWFMISENTKVNKNIKISFNNFHQLQKSSLIYSILLYLSNNILAQGISAALQYFIISCSVKYFTFIT